jgi:hypothetical protein
MSFLSVTHVRFLHSIAEALPSPLPLNEVLSGIVRIVPIDFENGEINSGLYTLCEALYVMDMGEMQSYEVASEIVTSSALHDERCNAGRARVAL